jgi:hypothetical protein
MCRSPWPGPSRRNTLLPLSPLPPVTAHLMGLHSAIKMLQQQLITLQQLMGRVNSGERGAGGRDTPAGPRPPGGLQVPLHSALGARQA